MYHSIVHMPPRTSLGELELVVLLALVRLGEGAYGAGIREEVRRRTGRRISPGAIYPTLDRLERRGTETAADAASWLRREAGGQRPIFLWVHLYDPHAPYDAPPAFARRFPDRAYDAEVAAADWALGDLLAHVLRHEGHMIVRSADARAGISRVVLIAGAAGGAPIAPTLAGPIAAIKAKLRERQEAPK